MKTINRVEFLNGSKQERLPDFDPDFPYIASKFTGSLAPWHWHREVEVFYIEQGTLEYFTPGGKTVFPAGSGGMVNSNVLHMTKPQEDGEKLVQLNHIFDATLIGGRQGSRIEQKYILPLTAASQIEMIALYPGDPAQERILDALRQSFRLSAGEFAYEIKLCRALSDIWTGLLEFSKPRLREKGGHDKKNDKLKTMMIYVHEHYGEKISIPEISAAAFVSERECYRAFRDCLRMTPVEYLKSYRLQKACGMLENSGEPVTAVGQACGLGSSSYFGKVFREQFGCTPSEYRRKWQNNDSNRR